MTDTQRFTVSASDVGRLDLCLTRFLVGVSRSRVQAWCKLGNVMVNGRVRAASFPVSEGDTITFDEPQGPNTTSAVPEDLPLDVVFEDEHLVVINKAAGMVVHPGAGIWSGTLANALAFHFSKLSSQGGALRPGIVHRLDRGTSGIMVVAKTDQAHNALAQQWQDREVTKVYKALVWGVLQPGEGTVETLMGRDPQDRKRMAAAVESGKPAVSRFLVREVYPEACLVNVHILTGRTHQIRVHMASLGHPVVGDALYGGRRHAGLVRAFKAMPDMPMLHAGLLRFRHPKSGQVMDFKQPPPSAFLECARQLAIWPHG